MSRFVVVVNTNDVISEALDEYEGGKVVDTKELGGEESVKVVKFDDETAGIAFSQALNGTVFRAQWAAEENARHRATSST